MHLFVVAFFVVVVVVVVVALLLFYYRFNSLEEFCNIVQAKTC